MLFILFGNLEQFLLNLLFMSKAEVICRFSQSGFNTLKSVFNSTAFQQWCQHHMTVPFLSYRKHPSCICQEFDTSLAWARKTYGCSFISNMGDAWEQCFSHFHCYCGDTMLAVWSPTRLPCWSNMVWFPVAFDTLLFSATTVVTLPSCIGGGAHTIEQGTRQFGVWHFGSWLTLCIWSVDVQIPIKTYFNLRYARYAIKSDHFVVLKIYYLISYLKQN